MMTTKTEMPTRIAKDDHPGRWTTRKPKGMSVDTYTAQELTEFAQDGEVIVWTSFGHVDGTERFARTRFLPDAEGNLHGYASNGQRIIIHPATRALRILTRR